MANPATFRESWLRPFLFYGNNRMSLIGGAVTTASAMVLVGYWIVTIVGHGGSSNPYLGIIFELCLPALFVAGLLLIPVGIAIRRRHLQVTNQVPSVFPEITLSDPAFRRGIDFVAIATLINFVIVGTASYRGVAYMDTPSFCGATCHVMAPEFAAYHVSSHAGVACTECHVAPGATGYLHAKVNGTKQLLMVIAHNYPTPIGSDNKVPAASATCLRCHNPEGMVGDRLKITASYGDDATNTKTSTLTMLHVGGKDSFGRLSGIHGAHMGKIAYQATDNTNQTISWVGKTNQDGTVTEFLSADARSPTAGPKRRMDCIDCHNRAAHSFDTPEDVLNKNMALGSPNVSLPFVHQEGLALIKAKYESREVAKIKITNDLATFYRSQYPAVWNTQQAQIHDAATTLVTIYSNNIFPSMNVIWGTHANNIGHTNSPGCFRCHDGSHSTKSAVSISNDCTVCHNLLVMDEIKPKLLADLGIQL
ncbi:NapC/NirT family cytochrome c [soil metagenome]